MSEAEEPIQPADGRSFVVIAHDDPGLEQLTRASIALRKLGDPHRHYVVCFNFPPSMVEHNRRRADLRMASEGRKYGWSSFIMLPVGASPLHDSLISHRWRCSSEALAPHRKVLGDDLVNALSDWSASGYVDGGRLFFPCTSGNALTIRHGSIFFPTDSEKAISQVAVYAMVSAAIQRAREPTSPSKTDRSLELSFDDNPLVRSVLDPSMFARFSDGILQASLLRATHPSELDYSANDAFSRQLSLDAVSVLTNHENAVGDATIEYVYAFATNKVSLRRDDHETVRQKIESIPILFACWELFQHRKRCIVCGLNDGASRSWPSEVSISFEE